MRFNLLLPLSHYNVKTAKCNQREAKYGSIKIRLRMELEDERTLLLSNLRPLSPAYVNVDSRKNFHVIRTTVNGNVDMKRYSIVSGQ